MWGVLLALPLAMPALGPLVCVAAFPPVHAVCTALAAKGWQRLPRLPWALPMSIGADVTDD